VPEITRRCFENLLNATWIGQTDGRDVWRLNDPLVWMFGDGRRIVVPKLFETDLASVPRVPVIYEIWGDKCHREAVLHDYCYRLYASVMHPKGPLTEISKEDADWYFRMAMISRGQPYYIYQPMYLAVRAFARRHYHRMQIWDHIKLDRAE